MITAILLVLIMAGSLIACGSKKETKDSGIREAAGEKNMTPFGWKQNKRK